MGAPPEYIDPQYLTKVRVFFIGLHGNVRIIRNTDWPGGISVLALSGPLVVQSDNGTGLIVCPIGFRPPAQPPSPLAIRTRALARRLVRRPAAPAAPAAGPELPPSLDTAEGSVTIMVSAQTYVYFDDNCQGTCTMAEAGAEIDMATQRRIFIN